MAKVLTTKEKILEQCTIMFAKKGYDGVSMRDIASAVGIKESSVYNHFKGKQDILDNIIKVNTTNCENVLKSIFTKLSSDNFIMGYSDVKGFKILANDIFKLYLTEKSIMKFWSILSVEQFENKKTYEILSRLYFDDVLGYIMELFQKLSQNNILKNVHPAVLALEFYSTLYVIFQRYFAPNHESYFEITPISESMISQHINNFYNNNKAF